MIPHPVLAFIWVALALLSIMIFRNMPNNEDGMARFLMGLVTSGTSIVLAIIYIILWLRS
jgi:hypothetical protein